MSTGSIRVVNARQNNLRGVTVEIPHRTLTVVTGPSGSGKSSLAFETLYAEGQRRYIESLSTYAKQFLDRMPKPLVDRIEGIAPSIAIEQRNPVVSSRSTVGTATEAYDFLRLLYARAGTPWCRVCGSAVRRDTPQSAADAILARFSDRFQIAFPLPASARTDHATVVENLRTMGFVRLLADGESLHLDDLSETTDISRAGEVMVVVDRLSAVGSPPGRIADAIATAFQEGEGVAVAVTPEDGVRFSESPACSVCDTPTLPLTPTLFSFNSPRGACNGCNGFGAVLEYDESLIIPDADRTLAEGAIDPWTKPRYETRRRMLREAAKKLGADFHTPWRRLKADHRRQLLHGKIGRYDGIFPFLRDLERKRYKQYIRVFLRQYQLAHTCPECAGARLNDHALAVRIGSENIAEVAARTVGELTDWADGIPLADFEREVALPILQQFQDRIRFLNDLGLGYLTLDRQMRTLSGGEAQRIALANAMGSRLVDTLYVLDEPSIGLHPRDMDRLLVLLRRLRDAGNTLVVVEHDPAAIRESDYMIEMGPGAGREGGQVVHAGPVEEAGDTLTGAYLKGRKRIAVPSMRRVAGPRWLRVKGATLHNLDAVDLEIPLGTLTAVTGVSGSGKSTMIHDVLYRQLERLLHGNHSAKSHLGEEIGEVSGVMGYESIEDAVLVDQSPIGRSPRSNPVTYIKGFDDIRELFADQPEARRRGYTPSTFSFNMPGGRCETCQGAGHVRVEMVFLADVFVPCETCSGTRYRREVLEVRVGGHSIHDVLQWTVDEAVRMFHHQPRLGAALWQLQQVGLGYLRLGQPATTLSGGEAQRLKIARELHQARKKKGRKLYILDEPTTGLHQDDVRTLNHVLDRLVDAGNTVIVIEHHLDVIKRADWVIDMGPEAGAGGGLIVAAGTPEEVAEVAESRTGRYLAEVLVEAVGSR